MYKGDASRLHQSSTESLALVKHCLVSSPYQFLIIVTLTVVGLTLPPNDLVRLPRSDAVLPRITAIHGAYLPLLIFVFLLQ